MNELTLDGKIYVSSKRAAEITGYAKDYVGQLCREGRVEARLVGRNWYILKTAIEKHRFATDAVEKEAPEPIAQDVTADTWIHPTYKEEVIADLPRIEAIEEADNAPEEEPAAPEASTIEVMQDAWRGWFEQIGSTEESQDAEIAPEPVDEPESAEISVPLHTIASTHEQPEVLNLRRIREYQPQETIQEEEAPISQVSMPRVAASRGYYRTVQAICIVVALLAVGVAYIGSGFASEYLISHKPASSIAGVSVYNKAQ